MMIRNNDINTALCGKRNGINRVRSAINGNDQLW